MTPFEKQRLEAVIELCGCLEGLIRTSSVPDYMVDYLQSRVTRFQRLYGLPIKPPIKPITPENIDA